jgi:glycosyltransferase involved in cell wall biosynthesis
MLQIVSQEFPDHHWSFFCISEKSGRLDDAFRQLGATVIHSRHPLNQKRAFVAGLRQVMKEGKYDVLHCHHDIISAIYLLASIGLPFRKRIVHVHNTAIGMLTPSRLKASLFRWPMRQLCLGMADRVVGISVDALQAMLARQRFKANRDTVVHYGIATSSFSSSPLPSLAIRESCGLPSTTRLLLFVGRLDTYKNPCFVLEILKCLSKTNPDIALLFAGRGPLEPELRRLAQEASLSQRVRLLGFRNDVPLLMQACNLLIWPSLEEPKEGLGLGIVEAQAAGLPLLMSRSVPREAIVVPELVTVLPLEAGPQAWAQSALEILNHKPPSRDESRARVESSSFSMTAGVSNLMALYEGVHQETFDRI